MSSTSGKLYLFPVPIGADELSVSLPAWNLTKLHECRIFVVEELRTARRFLKKTGYPYPIDDTLFMTLNEHTTPEEVEQLLAPLQEGNDVGLLSEAGLPCVADPGARLVALAQRHHITVVPLVGPSSLMLALMASGLNGQSFAFAGYLPVEQDKLAATLRNLEYRALKEGQTQLFIEAPYRTNKMLGTLSRTLHPETRICIACDLTLPTETILTRTAKQWQKERSQIDLHKRNTVFLIGR